MDLGLNGSIRISPLATFSFHSAKKSGHRGSFPVRWKTVIASISALKNTVYGSIDSSMTDPAEHPTACSDDVSSNARASPA